MHSTFSVRALRAGVVLGSAAFVAACSSASPSAGSAADDLVINPIASEHESNITLQLPTDACLPGATCAKVLGATPAVYIDGALTALGAKTRLKPGSHNIAVNGLGWQLATQPDQTQTITLPIVARQCTNATLPNVPVTNFGGGISVTNAPCPTTAQGSAVGVPAGAATNGTLYYAPNNTACGAVWSASVASTTICANAGSYPSTGYYYITRTGTCVATGIGPTGCVAAANVILSGNQSQTPGTTALTDFYQATVPGTLSATVNGTAQTLTVNAGDEVPFNLSLPALGSVPATFATTLTFDDPRANPDAIQGTITSSCSGDRTYTIPAATGTPAPLALQAFVNSSCLYTLNVSGRSQALSQSAANNIELHRLDVDPVTVTREDGTTYVVNGTYTLNYGGVQVAGPFNTGTGIDVLSGTYQFSLNFTDFDGPETQTQTITF